jgi:hypothetical protein
MKVVIPSNPGFYALHYFENNRQCVKYPIVGWRIDPEIDEMPTAITTSGMLNTESNKQFYFGILHPDRSVYSDKGGKAPNLETWFTQVHQCWAELGVVPRR